MTKQFTARTDFVVPGVGTFQAGKVYPVGKLDLEALKDFAKEVPTKTEAKIPAKQTPVKETPTTELGDE